eukprot:644648-Karenia_brevis.AAC.1
MAMLKRKAKVGCCSRVVREALAQRNIKFRKLRSKPLLTSQDKQMRMQFATKYRQKPATFWINYVMLHIDCKTFPAYVTSKAREYAAQREVRGAYRESGQGLDEAYVVAPKELRFNPGCKAIKIVAGVGDGKMLLWHDYGSRWSGSVAAE